MRQKWWGILLAAATFGVYFISGRGIHTEQHFFVPLAARFLQGQISIERMYPGLDEMVSRAEIDSGYYRKAEIGERGKFYVIFPPLPAFIVMPFVLIWGEGTNQSVVSMLVAAISVYLAYLTLSRIIKSQQSVWWLTVLYAFGSTMWYHAVVGSGWYFAQICALLTLWVALCATLARKSLWLVGLAAGAAYLCRYNLILLAPLWIVWNWERKGEIWKLMLPIIVALILSFAYNYIRYGRIDHFGYQVLEQRDYNLANEYGMGSYNLDYFGRHIYALFAALPDFSPTFPYVWPNRSAMALWLVFPAIFILWVVPWMQPLALRGLAAILLLLPATVFHAGVGASQFGYRYMLDYLPFLLILMALAMRERVRRWQQILIILSVLVNVWGVVMLV